MATLFRAVGGGRALPLARPRPRQVAGWARGLTLGPPLRSSRQPKARPDSPLSERTAEGPPPLPNPPVPWEGGGLGGAQGLRQHPHPTAEGGGAWGPLGRSGLAIHVPDTCVVLCCRGGGLGLAVCCCGCAPAPRSRRACEVGEGGWRVCQPPTAAAPSCRGLRGYRGGGGVRPPTPTHRRWSTNCPTAAPLHDLCPRREMAATSSPTPLPGMQ